MKILLVKTRFKIYFLLLLPFICIGQNKGEKRIHCKIISENASVEGVNILNIVSEKITVSDKNGEFYILAKADDLLLITSLNLEIKRKLIEGEDLHLDIINIKMIWKMTELKQVNVNENANITAENLGIVPKNQKKYTPAERKLYTAGDFKPIQLLAIIGGGMPFDPVLNAINGRTKQLKKQLKVEKKELLLVKLDNQFVDEYYINQLHIPEDYVDGFKYFLLEDETFVSVFLGNDKLKTKFKMSEMSVKYNQLSENEN